MKKSTKTVGERIAGTRCDYGLSQVQLAATLGVTRQAISQYEQDKIRPRTQVIDRLAELFNAAPEWFERGRGKAPDVLDAPVTILEINVDLLTSAIGDPRDLYTGRKWSLPNGIFPGVDIAAEHMLAIIAPNSVATVQQGDRVVIDIRLRDGDGVSLVVDEGGAKLREGGEIGPDAQVVGRAVACLHTL